MVELADNVRKFLEQVHLAVIGTGNRDGTVHQTALWYELRDSTIVMSTGTASRKVRNLKRTPRASVCVADLNPARHVTLEGSVTFDDAHVLEDLTRLASRYIGPEAGPGVAKNIAAIPHITLALRIERVHTFGEI